MLADRLRRCFTGSDGRPCTLQLPRSSLQIFSCKLIVVDSLAQCRQPSDQFLVRESTLTQALLPSTSRSLMNPRLSLLCAGLIGLFLAVAVPFRRVGPRELAGRGVVCHLAGDPLVAHRADRLVARRAAAHGDVRPAAERA